MTSSSTGSGQIQVLVEELADTRRNTDGGTGLRRTESGEEREPLVAIGIVLAEVEARESDNG